MSNIEAFLKKYNQFSKFDNLFNTSGKFFIQDYKGIATKEGESDFLKFSISLLSFANSYSVKSIKQTFDDDMFFNELNEKGHTLYILAKAEFNGIKFIVKATSEHKYHNEFYIVEQDMN